MLSKFEQYTIFGAADHRSYNRNGEAFDKGETFSGVDYELGLKAVRKLKELFHTEELAPFALRWILMHDAVSAVIPGASKKEQVVYNLRAAELPTLSNEQMKGVSDIYNRYIRATVQDNW